MLYKVCRIFSASNVSVISKHYHPPPGNPQANFEKLPNPANFEIPGGQASLGFTSTFLQFQDHIDFPIHKFEGRT